MENWLWACIGVLACIIAVLFVKIYLMEKAAREIEEAFADRLMTDTNTLISISSRDRYMRSLANAVNIQLRALRAQRRCLRQGDRELKNAVTNISHDLRTPLTAICGYLDLLEQEEMSEAARRYLEVIRDRADMLTQLTDELFRYSIILSGEKSMTKKPVVINHVLEESAAAFYSALGERNITPDIRMPDAKVVRMLDRSALARVFSNLISNAIKYSDGDLVIALSEGGEITFSNRASGLTRVQVGKLFDRFYTVEAARKSTGLGLAIARTLTEQMNGRMWAEYENDRLSIHICFSDEDSAFVSKAAE